MDNKDNIELIVTEDNFDTWTNSLSQENREDLYNKDVLVLPEINYGKIEGASYHEDVMDFLDYIDSKEQKINYGLCSDEEKILSLNDGEIWFWSFLVYAPMVNPIMIDVFINMLSNYLYDKFTKLGKNPQVKCKIKVIKEKNKTSKTFDYSGDAETLQKISSKVIESFKNEK